MSETEEKKSPCCTHPIGRHGFSGCTAKTKPAGRHKTNVCPCKAKPEQILNVAIEMADFSVRQEIALFHHLWFEMGYPGVEDLESIKEGLKLLAGLE